MGGVQPHVQTIDSPVKMEEKANATIVVAITARGLSSPTSSAIWFAMRWKKGCKAMM